MGPGVSFSRDLVAGPEVVSGDVRVTPRSRTITVRLPWAAFVWNRPADVLVVEGDNTRRLPIVDRTRRVQSFLKVFVMAATLLAGVLAMRERSKIRD